MTADGAGNLTGTEGGSRSGQSFIGSYSITANGRANLAARRAGSVSNMVFYLVSPSTAVGIQLDAGATAIAVSVIESQAGGCMSSLPMRDER
jgi:hypothetical protein